VVDKDQRAIERLAHLPVEAVHEDGLTYLGQLPLERCPIDYIIPAVPFHLAFEYILSKGKIQGMKRTSVPEVPGLPNPQFGKTGDLYTSLADFLCPEDCPEPPGHCTVTGGRREKPLYQLLSELYRGYELKVIRSEQLGPGVGGFRPEVLDDLFEDLKEWREENRPMLISTACRCHGVISALARSGEGVSQSLG
jgi:hypothetical protein